MTTVDRPTTQGWVADDATFGARLALVRQRMHWGNVKEAAVACGLPTESWRSWERDGRVPQRLVETAGVIADRTGCDYTWLVMGPARSSSSPKKSLTGPARTAMPRSTQRSSRPRDSRPPSGVSADKRRPALLRSA